MEQFNDISKYVEKAQGDKARFLKSKEGLLPHFEFPTGETKEEKHYSTETLLADMYEEKIDQVKEMTQNPILLENAYRNLQNNIAQCSKKKEEVTNCIYYAFRALSALITTHSLSRLSPEKQNEINSCLENPFFLENTYQYIQYVATQGSKEEGINTDNAFYAFRTLSALISTNSISRFFPGQQSEIASYLENPILLENLYMNIESNAVWGSKKEGINTDNASWAFFSLSALISTDTLSHLSPEKQNEINTYIENPILIENAYRYLRNYVTRGSGEDGKDTSYASWALQTLSSLITVKDYLREKGKKIDDENFAKEALNPTEKIPPRPETRNNY